ncbi:hypothetical protein LX95_01859 [Mesonia algae]|uniref:Uncharacterized protein n=1 Tax=Mesonia algae TaxID=213248 RepID=A0A2W7I1G7_9FLAO|nr:hypothetical protein [Mesonia algae]PZW40791.1 hypothetical protein LX95_01859 [Mesonia algae]
MKNIVVFMIFSHVFFSCTDTDERPEISYEVSFKNNTNLPLQIKGFSIYDELEYEYEISSMSSGGDFTYDSENFDGYRQRADSIVFIFPNNKGYICADRVNANNLCFNGKSPLGNDSSFSDLGNNIYEFIITQEDYDNAYTLP